MPFILIFCYQTSLKNEFEILVISFAQPHHVCRPSFDNLLSLLNITWSPFSMRINIWPTRFTVSRLFLSPFPGFLWRINVTGIDFDEFVFITFDVRSQHVGQMNWRKSGLEVSIKYPRFWESCLKFDSLLMHQFSPHGKFD